MDNTNITLDDARLAEIEKAAKAAKDGAWAHYTPFKHEVVSLSHQYSPTVALAVATKDAAHIVATQPRVALAMVAEIRMLRAKMESLTTVHPAHAYQDDDGDVLWYLAPISSPPFHVGTPNDSDWPWEKDEAPESTIVWTRLPNPATKTAKAKEAADA